MLLVKEKLNYLGLTHKKKREILREHGLHWLLVWEL